MAIFKAKQNVINSQVTPRVVRYFGSTYTTDAQATTTQWDVYDNQEQWRVTWSTVPAPRTTDSTDGATLTFNANTYHSISLIVLSWAVTVLQNWKTHTFDTWYTYTYTATQLADNPIRFTQASADCVASITTITL